MYLLRSMRVKALLTLAVVTLTLGLLATQVFAGNDKKLDPDFDELGFIFTTLSIGLDEEGEKTGDRWLMTGSGEFNNKKVKGGGMFIHTDFNDPIPQPVLGAGTWKAERVIGFEKTEDPNNPYARNVSGILDLQIRLFPDGGPKKGVPATLKVVCNIPAIEGKTGLPEGIFLDIDDGLSFEPIIVPPPFGLTALPILD